jgi:hypothetical protein
MGILSKSKGELTPELIETEVCSVQTLIFLIIIKTTIPSKLVHKYRK